MGTGTESSAEHGIEARTGNDVTGPEMTSSNWKCYHGNRDEPEMEKKSRDTLMDRFNTFFIEFMASVHCLGIPVVLLLVDRREEESGWCRTNLVDKWVVTRNESCVDE